MAAIAAMESVVQWRSVEDESPEMQQGIRFLQSGYLLVIARGRVFVGILRDVSGKARWVTPDSIRISGVSHFARLPAPPADA